MNDRELLKLAAKAVGMPSLHDANGVYVAWVGDPESGHWWNPLADDGDALWLAVKLRIDIYHHTFPGEIEAVSELGGAQEDRGGDEFFAARRAIVRAAAEIGRGMT